MDSDHHLIKAVVRARISIAKIQQNRREEKINVDALKNEEVAHNFSEQVKQLLETTENQDRDQTTKQKWNTCAEALKTAAKNALGTQGNNNKIKDWFDEEVGK